MNRFQFVEDHKDAYGVKRLCEVVEVARSSFYAWLDSAGRRAAKATDDAVLAARIRVLQDPAQGGDRAYGAPRITADLNDGVPVAERVNHKRVARVMREHRLAGIRLRRRVKTTIPDQSARRFPDLIGRDFSVGDPGRRYVGDITYLPIADGTNLYLATVIDCYSRRLVGWAIADHMRTELVEDALKAAAATRGTLKGSVFHSDHGSVGEFNWSSQHLDRGGVQLWRRGTGPRRRAMCPRVRVGNGVRIGRCVRRCVRPGGLSPRGRCSGSSGV